MSTKRNRKNQITLLTAKEAASRIQGISAATLRRYAREHRIPFVQISAGKRMLFNLEDLEAVFTPTCFQV